MSDQQQSLAAFTKLRLALNNGQGKSQIWLAFHGFIYKIADSRVCGNGCHIEHWADQTLTDAWKDAPQVERVF